MVVRSFQVRVTPPETVLERLEENLFPKRKTLDNKPLTLPEQTKLLYQGLLGKPGTGKPSLLLTGLDKIRGAITNKTDNWIETLQTNRDDLESRNQAQLEKLLDLLKNNPAEALKYAIPLDEGGTDAALKRLASRSRCVGPIFRCLAARVIQGAIRSARRCCPTTVISA